MDYLYKIYYNKKANHEIEYTSRYNFTATLKTGLYISPLKSSENYELYFVFNKKTSCLIEQIRKYDDELKVLESSLPGMAKKTFLVEIIASELHSSNNLEGIETNKSELIETTRKIVDNQTPKNSRLSSMINSYFLLSEDFDHLTLPIDCNDIRKIYDKITDKEIDNSNLPDGKYFRKEDVFIQKKNTISGEIIHKGISGEKNIEDKIISLLNFLNNSDIPNIIKSAISHYYFEYIHPFYDGNGRVGRFITSMYIKNDYNYLTSMSLSRGSYIKKTEYYKTFSNTNLNINKGELNYFIDTFLKILIAGQEDILENLKDKIDKLDYASEFIENNLKQADTVLKKNILFLLLQSYYFDYNFGISRDILIKQNLKNNFKNTIINELKKLEEMNLIIKVKKRPIVYAINDNIIS